MMKKVIRMITTTRTGSQIRTALPYSSRTTTSSAISMRCVINCDPMLANTRCSRGKYTFVTRPAPLMIDPIEVADPRREEVPGQQAAHQPQSEHIQSTGITRRGGDLQDVRKHEGEDQHRGQRIQHRPAEAENRSLVSSAQLPQRQVPQQFTPGDCFAHTHSCRSLSVGSILTPDLPLSSRSCGIGNGVRQLVDTRGEEVRGMVRGRTPEKVARLT